MKRSTPAVLTVLLDELRSLEGRIHTMANSPQEVIEAGRALLAFARQEDRAFSSLRPLMDPVVIKEMSAEHDEINSDLELLEWITRATPGSPDADVLAESLARRMRCHVSRDGRLLARAAGLPPRTNQ